VNIKEYISSGILESYVLGELNARERADVERNLELYPELKPELNQIEQAQEMLLMESAISPSPAVKAVVMNRIESRQAKVVSISSTGSTGFWRMAAAASITVAVVASIFAYNFRNKWKAAEANLIALSQQNSQIAENYNQVNDRLNKLQNDVDILTDPQFKTVVMKGTTNAPEALATVYWNESTREVYLRIQSMKDLTNENQYQLWAIIDGKPVDAGVFDVEEGLVKMKNVGKGAVLFAVTIEPRGGKASPSLETMQVKGEVGKA